MFHLLVPNGYSGGRWRNAEKLWQDNADLKGEEGTYLSGAEKMAKTPVSSGLDQVDAAASSKKTRND